jgi:triacylglycerol lipase
MKAYGAAAMVAATLWAGSAAAQIPADVQARMREIGRVVAPVDTAKLYRPMFGPDLLAGVTVVRDAAFGTDPRQTLNVYKPAAAATGRPVLVFVPGGMGAKQMGGPEGEPFYDNVGAWGVKNGMLTIVTQFRAGPGVAWDAGARDVGATIAWAKAHAREHGGDPDRIYVFGQSNGATQTATWLGHPEIQGAGGPGVKAAVLMGGAWNILPLKLNAPPPGPPGGAPPPVDPAVMLQRSNLAGLKTLNTPLLLIAAELDPEERTEMIDVLGAELRKAGKTPTTVIIPGHSHMSEILSFGSADTTASEPVLQFLRGVR